MTELDDDRMEQVAKDSLGTLNDHPGLSQRLFSEDYTIQGITCTAQFLIDHGEDVERVSKLRDVKISDLGDVNMFVLLTRGTLQRICALDLSDLGISDEKTESIAVADLNHLVWLDLSGNNIHERGAVALMDSIRIRKIPYLGFDRNPVDMLPRPGGIDQGQVMDTHYPDLYHRHKNLRDGQNPEWLTTEWLYPRDFRDQGVRGYPITWKTVMDEKHFHFCEDCGLAGRLVEERDRRGRDIWTRDAENNTVPRPAQTRIMVHPRMMLQNLRGHVVCVDDRKCHHRQIA